MRAEAVVEDDRDLLRAAVRADRRVGAPVVSLEQLGRDVPARLVQHLDRVQGRRGAVARREPAQHVDRVRQVLLAGVPLADVQDAAVVEAVLAAGRRVQVEHDAQAELGRPVERPVEHLDAALDEGVRIAAVLRVVRIGRAEDPVAERECARR